MAEEVFNGHDGALEKLFYQDDSEREKVAAASSKAVEALGMVSGISDTAVLEKMVALGIKSDTLAALSLVPLIKVAWADGTVDAKERKAVAKGAEAAGIYAGSHGRLLLESWMDNEPEQALYNTWADYIRTLKQNLGADEMEIIRNETIGRARKIAEASGGFTKSGATSDVESDALAEMEVAFTN